MNLLIDIGAVLFILGLIGAALGTILYLYRVYKSERYLEKNHKAIWQSLGNTHLVKNNPVRNRFIKYIKSKQYLVLSDPLLNNLCSQAQTAYYITGISYAVLFVGSSSFWLPYLLD